MQNENTDAAIQRREWWSFLRKTLSATVALVGILLAGYYIFGPSRVEFHADCTDTILWAQTTRESGRWLDPDFQYACFLPFGGQLLMGIFLPIFGLSMKSQACGMLLFTLLFCAALVWCCFSVGFSWEQSARTLGLMLLVLLCSGKLREIFFGHIIYYSLGVLMLLTAFSLSMKLLAQLAQPQPLRSARFWIFSVILGVFLTLCALNGIQALALCAFPLLCAWLGNWFLRKEPLFSGQKQWIFLAISGGIALCSLVGLGFRALMIGAQSAGYANAHGRFSAPTEWMNNLRALPGNWFTLLGIEVSFATEIASVEGIVAIIQIACAGLLLLLPFVALRFYRRFSQKEQMLLLACAGMSAFVLFGWVCGMLSSANWRLTPLLCASILSCAVLLRRIAHSLLCRRALCCVLAVLTLFCTQSAVRVLRLSNHPADHPLYRITETLREKGLTYGYATFWNANAITLLSDDTVRVRMVLANKEQGLTTDYYQSAHRWYEDQPGVTQYFLLLTEAEYQSFKWSNWYEAHPAKTKEPIGDGYILLLYETNPMTLTARNS